VAWSLLRDVSEDASISPRLLGERTAWILLGDLQDALFQAGCIARILVRDTKPAFLLGAGIASINAVLASTASATAFERAWERLRARRFVAAAALPDTELLAGWLRTRELVASGLRHMLSSIEVSVPVFLASGTRFIEGDSDNAPLLSRQLVAAVSSANELGSAHVASAVREAIAHGAHRILLFGASNDEIGLGAARAAFDEAEAYGIVVEVVLTEHCPKPSLLELLLPGSGAVERVMAAGARAADTICSPAVQKRAAAAPDCIQSGRLRER
jgi:hypothetical protein